MSDRNYSMATGSNIRTENKDSMEQKTQKSLNLVKLFKRDPQFDINTHQLARLSPPKDQAPKGENSRDNQFAAAISFQTERPDQTLHKNISNDDLQKIQQELEFLRNKVAMLESQSLNSPNKANVNQFTPFDQIEASPNKFELNKANVSGHLSPLQQNPQLSPPQLQHPQWYSQSSNFSNMLFTPPYTLSHYITPFPNFTYPTPTVLPNDFVQNTVNTALLSQKPQFQFFGQDQKNQANQPLKTSEFGEDTSTKVENTPVKSHSKISPNAKEASILDSKKPNKVLDLTSINKKSPVSDHDKYKRISNRSSSSTNNLDIRGTPDPYSNKFTNETGSQKKLMELYETQLSDLKKKLKAQNDVLKYQQDQFSELVPIHSEKPFSRGLKYQLHDSFGGVDQKGSPSAQSLGKDQNTYKPKLESIAKQLNEFQTNLDKLTSAIQGSEARIAKGSYNSSRLDAIRNDLEAQKAVLDQLKLSKEILENHFNEIEPQNSKQFKVQNKISSRKSSIPINSDTKPATNPDQKGVDDSIYESCQRAFKKIEQIRRGNLELQPGYTKKLIANFEELKKRLVQMIKIEGVDKDTFETKQNDLPPKEPLIYKPEFQFSPIVQRNPEGEDFDRHDEYERIKLKNRGQDLKNVLNWSAEPMNKRKKIPSRQRSPRYEPAIVHNRSSVSEREAEDVTRESLGREPQATALDPTPNDIENNKLEFEREFAALHQGKLTIENMLLKFPTHIKSGEQRKKKIELERELEAVNYHLNNMRSVYESI